jgi:hypothetical protein
MSSGIQRHVDLQILVLLKFTNISEEYGGSIFIVEE